MLVRLYLYILMGSSSKKGESVVIMSIISSIVLAAIKWLAGYYGNSYALIADAIESSADVVASMLVLLGLLYARRPADDNHPYGHGRIEPLITFVVVGFLIVSAAAIGYQSIKNITTPHDAPQAWTLWILAAIICWKEINYQIVMRKSRQLGSTTLQAEAWHHRSDAMTSMAAFAGISLAIYLGEGYEYIDDIAALLASIMILYNCFKIFRPALGEIMDEHIHPELVEKIRAIALDVEHVKGTEKCYVRKVGTGFYVDLHAIVDGNFSVYQGHEIAHKLKDALMQKLPEISDVLIHIEPDGTSSEAKNGR